MDTRDVSRRELLMQGSAAFIGLAFLNSPRLAQAFPSRPGEEVIPWLDQPPAHPRPRVVSNQPSWAASWRWTT